MSLLTIQWIGTYFAEWSRQYLHLSLPLLVMAVVWLAVMWLAGNQLRRLHWLTVQLTIKAVRQHPHLDDQQIWRLIYPEWVDLVGRTVIFLPNRWNIWIEAATIERAASRMDFCVDWVHWLRMDSSDEPLSTRPAV